MGRGLTRRQAEILTFIQRYSETHGYPPSVREIGRALGLTSSSTVHSHLAALEKKGYLHRDPSKPRALEILRDEHALPPKKMVPLPVVGRVAAGTPILAQENIEDYFPLPTEFLRDGEGFILHARGDSMIEAGIQDGDYLIVRRQPTARDGDIVVARLEDEATVKRFFREDGHIRLQPENPAMEAIHARDVHIEGKVVGLIRRMTS
ncbi:MAG: transcriptional repressor LexA [Armatimonadetes bacterium]|nr:transcriptional repressor LexA [Armatimonadota bacterium]